MFMFLLLSCNSSDVPTALARRGDLELRLEFKGEFEARKSYEVVVPDLDGRPEIEWLVEDGSRVEAGDKLVVFDTEDMHKRLVQAQAQLDIANTKIEQHAARLELSRSGAVHEVRLAALDQELAAMRQTSSQTVPLVERESARVDAIKAKMATEDANTAAKRVELDGATDLQLLELEAAQRERDVERANEQIAAATMVAPGPGLVVIGEGWEGKYKVGSSGWPGSILLRLPNLSRMQVVGWVHEVDSPALRLDQVGIITMDAHPTEPAEVRLARIADLAIARGEDRAKYVRVVLEIDETTPKMKPGMTVDVDLETAFLEDVVLLPVAALNRGRDGTTVWTANTFGWTEVPVEILGKTRSQAAVSGVAPGSTVALENPEP